MKALFRVFALDVKGVMWPTEFRPSVDHTVAYHRPIFTWVCPNCGAREESYSRWMRGSSLGPSPPRNWIRMSVVLNGDNIAEFGVCGETCVTSMTDADESLTAPPGSASAGRSKGVP